MGAIQSLKNLGVNGGHTNLAYSMPLRFFIAYIWLNSGITKLSSLATDPNGFIASMTNVFANTWAAKNPNPWVANFLNSFVVPNAGMVVRTIAVSEFLLGVAFLLGIMVRPASIVGILMNSTFYLAAGFTSASTGSLNLLLIGAQASTLLISPGRLLGLDVLLHKKFSKIPLW